MGLDEKEFIKVFLIALGNDEVIKKLQGAVCIPIQDEVNELRKIIKEKDAKIASLESKITDLELQVDDLEQYSRRNSLRFNGVTESDSEDVTKKVTDLINDTLKVHPPVSPNDIDRVHRTGRRKPGKPRAILVKFTNYGIRDKVIRNRAQLRPPNLTTASLSPVKQTVFVNEDLTKYRSNLLFQARQLKKNRDIQDCWSWDGRILIRNKKAKIMNIKTVEELKAAAAVSTTD